MKKNIYFLLIIATFISFICFVQSSNAKYKDTAEVNISVTSAKMYFEDNASDINIPYANNTANFTFDVHNYKDNNYTNQDIEYTISLANANYKFYVNDNSSDIAISNDFTIEGGARNSEELKMHLVRTETQNVPETEDVVVTISTKSPYTYSKSFTVKILNGAIEVQGNPTTWTNEDVTLTIVASSTGTTLTEYSFDNGTTWGTNPSKVYSENVDGIKVLAKDLNGHVLGPIELDITKIDKISPIITFEKDNEHWKNEQTEELELKEVETLIVTLDEPTSVLTGVNATDALSGISEKGVKCYKNDIEITTTDYFNNVGRYVVTYKVEDEAGNQTSLNREILVRWPKAGKYVVKKTEIDGNGIVGTGLATDSSKMGLYKDDASTGLDSSLDFSSKYYYAGKNVNNYFTFNKDDSTKSFRIFNVAVNDEIKLVGPKSSDTIRYGTHEQSEMGIIHTELYQSWVNLWAAKQFYIDASDKITFTDNEWSHINGDATFYVGGFKMDQSTSIATTVQLERTGDSEWTKETSYTGYSALPNVSDYLKTSNIMNTVYSIDTTSKYITFANNSWIAAGIGALVSDSQWTINGGSNGVEYNKYFYYFMYGNRIGDRNPLDPNRIRVVFYIKEDTILSGIGSSSDPYTVQENWAWFDPYQVAQ